MSQYLGDISAYALAVSQGYTGTEEEYAELMASYATVGQTAVTAAQTATTKASEAATSATTATNKASEATTAATTATTKAGEASTSASTATSAKDTAVSASQTATTKATEATTAAATATSAKTDAVAANTAAQSAKTAAQTAQAGAETAAASVQSSAAQIATNTSDINELKEDFTTTASKEDMLKAFPTDTASGSVASFADGANVPVKTLIVNIDPVQSGSGDPSPDNVRPISGWTGANVTANGINQWDEQWENCSYGSSDGIKAPNANCIGNKNPIFVFPNTSFYFKIADNSADHNVAVYEYDAEMSYLGRKIVTASSNNPLTVSSATRYINFYWGTSTTGVYDHTFSINYPSTDTDYHVYNGSSVSINWQSEAGTVYGGTLDVTNGVLTVDRAMVDLGSLNWQYSAAGTNHERFTYADSKLLKGSICLCDRLQTVTYSDMYNHIIDNSIAVHPNAQQVEAYVSAYTDVNSFRSAMTGSQFCYKLATPLTIQLDPHEVTALLGSNNVWADTGDSVVEYRADPTLYIQRLTEPDADMVADANITSGQYFMVGNTLYKATANIASGATISPNVNCTRKSLSEALNELNA